MATTPNLGLHQWQAGDAFLRTDFNTDFSKIDTAMPRCVSGRFLGDSSSNRKITLGFKAKLIVLMGNLDGTYAISFVTPEFRAGIKPSDGTFGPSFANDIAVLEDGFLLKRPGFFNGGDYTCYFAIV